MTRPSSQGEEDQACTIDGVRVLAVLYYYKPYVSGLTLHMSGLLEDLARGGAQVDVICGQHDPGLPSYSHIDGVNVHRLRPLARVGKGMLLPSLIPATLKSARHADVVVPVLPLAEAAVITQALPARKRLPFYVCDLRLGRGPIDRVIESIASLSARRAIHASPRFAALSLDFARGSRVVGAYAPKAVEVPPPVTIRSDLSPYPGAFRGTLGFSDEPIVGFVGRLVPEKGLPVLLQAMDLVRSALPEARLVIVGDSTNVAGGGIRADLERRVGTDNRTTFTGFLSDEALRSFYTDCTVLALPSVDPLEAYGMVQVEAMLEGCPVVASDMPGVRLPVSLSGMGMLAPPGDPVSLAQAIITILQRRGDFLRPRREIEAIFSPDISFRAFRAEIASRVR